ncbi:hypothetical protein PIB30_024587 [Stylosanthes scabra]|uniref:Uncharacterized protein n=1 Tax=Stylosanthes scabra TaxID=79078 RepID=A0ABU6U986_9FABA|nr:hypothetical protein [Stylosanthes scabra]
MKASKLQLTTNNRPIAQENDVDNCSSGEFKWHPSIARTSTGNGDGNCTSSENYSCDTTSSSSSFSSPFFFLFRVSPPQFSLLRWVGVCEMGMARTLMSLHILLTVFLTFMVNRDLIKKLEMV